MHFHICPNVSLHVFSHVPLDICPTYGVRVHIPMPVVLKKCRKQETSRTPLVLVCVLTCVLICALVCVLLFTLLSMSYCALICVLICALHFSNNICPYMCPYMCPSIHALRCHTHTHDRGDAGVPETREQTHFRNKM